jgi:hypothetical protein
VLDDGAITERQAAMLMKQICSPLAFKKLGRISGGKTSMEHLPPMADPTSLVRSAERSHVEHVFRLLLWFSCSVNISFFAKQSSWAI